jgi:N-acetyl-anhydromuramyl-L-alanine amidase AmpD
MIYEPDTNTKYPLAGHIGVEMMGDFNKQRPSPQQLESAVRLIAWICDQHQIDVNQIATHKDVAPKQTSCPGSDFYRYMESGEFKQWVTSVLFGKDPKIDPGPPLDGGPTVIVGEPLPATQPAKKP